MEPSLPIETVNPLFGLYLYPQAKEIMEKQQDVNWFAQEIKVEKDIPDYKQKLSPEQSNLITVTLTGFVEIEQLVGDIWEEVASWFPHSEIEGACLQMAAMEKSVHAFFYQKMSDVLNIDPEETARAQEEITVLKHKLGFIQDIFANPEENKALTLATLALTEQVLLFSNFGMLKSFKANGNNLIKNTITGVDYVINDEGFHGELATYLHATYVMEYEDTLGGFDHDLHQETIRNLTHLIVAHEDAVIDYTFSGDTPINGITSTDLKTFIRSRANDVLINLGGEPMFEITHNPIAIWFYKGINAIKVHDFFVAGTNSYRRGWSLNSFTRIPHLGVSSEKA